MKRLFRSGLSPVLCGVALGSLLGTSMAHGQLPVISRTLVGPGEMAVACDGGVRTIYQSNGTKVCVTVQNAATSACGVTVDLVDYRGSTVGTQVVGVGESAALCGNKLTTINTTPGSTGGSATYQWRVDY